MSVQNPLHVVQTVRKVIFGTPLDFIEETAPIVLKCEHSVNEQPRGHVARKALTDDLGRNCPFVTTVASRLKLLEKGFGVEKGRSALLSDNLHELVPRGRT